MSQSQNPRWSGGLKLVPIRFEYTHPTARSVAIAGTFNDWHPTTKSMRYLGNGQWQKEAFLWPGDYEYCLVVDGQLMPDPLASVTVANSFGGRNSIVHVAKLQETDHTAETENLP